jgi:hypothetical protein
MRPVASTSPSTAWRCRASRDVQHLRPYFAPSAVPRNDSAQGELPRRAHRVVAGLIERYFFELKRQLSGQTREFWMRVESAFTARTPGENIPPKVEARRQSGPDEVRPAPGPRAKPTGDVNTPGTGTLPSSNDDKTDTGSG